MKKIIISIIKFYQKTISPDHGWFSKNNSSRFCKYHPTCSQYTIEAIDKKGVFAGIFLGFWRILRCNPWSRGGIDEVSSATREQAFLGAASLLIYILVLSMLLLVLINTFI